jgi:hypothetical protein
MTDMPGSRLWPLALMGWLAAYPPDTGKDDTLRVAGLEEREAEPCAAERRPGQRTAWLRAARQHYAALSPEERQQRHQQRRAGFERLQG